MKKLPFIFVPGTKAKADEVNDNFNVLVENLSYLERKIVSLELRVSKLENKEGDNIG